ncbi:DUF998 domain-containing protein [Glycomyces sp. NRRL B-16210]|uniref:DUF998 domain-containing protein n=1 Tax=Glycomyces sp. NRRL B-16210 TaxID=1463821 RepID=UPI00068D9D32|nr:DUF998 domain-containing protein [Glycomyces sp. NRRL B-16210]
MTTSSPRPHLDRVLLSCGFAPALFAAVLLIESFTRAGYDPWAHFGSELANGERGWTVIAAFICAGALTIAFAVGLRRSLARGRGAVAAPILFGLFGIGLVVAGAFVVDPKPGYPAGSTGAVSTLAGTIHDANLLPTWLVMTAAMAATARRLAAEPGGRPWAVYTIAAAVISIGALMTALAVFDSATQTGAWHGLWQRIAITIGFTWFGAIALQRLRSKRSKVDDRAQAA